MAGLPRYALLIGQGSVLAERKMPGYPVVDAVISEFSSQRGSALGREVGFFSLAVAGTSLGLSVDTGKPVYSSQFTLSNLQASSWLGRVGNVYRRKMEGLHPL